MTHGSLFSGIGGFDLAAEWMGWENVFHCEWNEFGRKVLNHYWPNAKSYEDITKSDFNIYQGRIDILSGGFPCQPYSSAGKRLGKEDDRHLWPEMLRAIREIQPRWVVGENVRGLINWNGGMVFDEVQADLEAEGYEVWPYVLPACAVNAPHRRDRIWFVAHSNNIRSNQPKKSAKQQRRAEIRTASAESCHFVAYSNNRLDKHEERKIQTRGHSIIVGGESIATNPERVGSSRKEHGQTESRQHPETDQRCGWQNFPTQPPICGGDDGLPRELDGITFPKWRNESIKAYGNAIVPQVAFQIFKAIEQYENPTSEAKQ